MRNLAFVLEDLSASQTAYSLVYNTNKWLQDNIDVCISIFYMNNYMPCIQPRFARFHTADIATFDGTLIATSFKTAMQLKKATRASRYYYITDLEWLRQWFDFSADQTVMTSKDIGKVVRSPDFLNNQFLRDDKNIKVIEDYDISKFVELANESTNS